MISTSPNRDQLRVESWTMYTLGVLTIIARLFSRQMVLGSWKRLQIEDWMMTINIFVYTILMVSVNIAGNTATNLYREGEYETFSDDEIKRRIYGSKIVILLEQAMLICTYITKGCMLMLYTRLASRLPHQRLIRIITAYSAFGFIGTELTWFFNCRPLSGYWALPVPERQCATYTRYVIVQAVFNLSSDVMILVVGMPLIMKARVDLKKKIILVAVFGLGIFVVLAAILNKFYNFTNPNTTLYMLWYIREASTAIYVANLPMMWPLFRKCFGVGRFDRSTDYSKDAVSAVEMSRKRMTRLASQNGNGTGSEEVISGAHLTIEQRVSFEVGAESRKSRTSSEDRIGYDVERSGNATYAAKISIGPKDTSAV
ncbi:hypothetical protein BZA77DRAFT_253448 [Pyronema omphalodes]|nr:hypothetical protein BZA77DRAFT_253448 [Pyronema omphalodes]